MLLSEMSLEYKRSQIVLRTRIRELRAAARAAADPGDALDWKAVPKTWSRSAGRPESWRSSRPGIMKGAIIKMKSTRYEGPFDTRASEWIGDMSAWRQANDPDNSEQRERLFRNLHKVMRDELTPRQRQMVEMYYFQKKNIPKIAEELGLNRSTVSRTLNRGMGRIQKYLKYSF